jgi:hypothetical protein
LLILLVVFVSFVYNRSGRFLKRTFPHPNIPDVARRLPDVSIARPHLYRQLLSVSGTGWHCVQKLVSCYDHTACASGQKIECAKLNRQRATPGDTSLHLH